MYRVTKHFVSGVLAGLTITELTSVRFSVGFRTESYEIVAVESV